MNLELSPSEASDNQILNTKITGLFEIHLTVDVKNNSEPLESFFQKFSKACDQINCKIEALQLDKGVYPTQIMTVSWQKGKPSDAMHQMQTIGSFLSSQGFTIIREKIEAEASNKGIPQTDEEAVNYPKSNYFEFHLSTEPLKANCPPLEEVCMSFSGYLADELFKVKKDKIRYVTLRYYGIGLKTAEDNLNRSISILKKSGYRVRGKVEMEYAIWDSNLRIDTGWAN